MSSSFRAELNGKLRSRPAADLSTRLSAKACVAVILKGSSHDDPEVAFIRRSVSQDDGWSGQLAFPGGRCEESDEDDYFTASREVREETGIELKCDELLAHLDDIQARRRGGMLDFFIRPLVFHIDRPVGLSLDPTEVADFFWVPLAQLTDPALRIEYEWSPATKLPAIDVGGDPPLWGLTYAMTLDLLARLA